MFRKVIKLDAFKNYGITSRIPQECAFIETLPQSGRFLPLFFQVEGFLQSESLEESLKKFLDRECPEINDFLDGKSFMIDDCSFVVNSYRDVFPSEIAALQNSKLMIQNQSPYIEILNFFDDCDSPDFIETEIQNDSCRITNYKIDCDATSRQKVSFIVHFDLKIQLKKRIQSLPLENFLAPIPIPNNIRFYNVLKVVLENSGQFYINEKKCIKLKNRNLEDSENSFLWDIRDYLGKTSLVDYFSLLQNEIVNSYWKDKLNFFSEYRKDGFDLCGKRLLFRESSNNPELNALYIDFPLRMKSPLLKERLEKLLEGLGAGLEKIQSGETFRSQSITHPNKICKDLYIRFLKSKEEPASQFLDRRQKFIDGMKSIQDGLQSALQYLEKEVWNKENDNPVDHLGEIYLQTMRLDPIVFSESEVPALKNYACQMISGTLLEI
ncbi:hypothetical protein [Fibrobacter sp. UWEL]|uniref:hypothetical protein n=1 Tax=Fibrobacter sp. UWEL TaxID=1896209 RepID=UPI000918F656|nr:hypothetical protein [Fibrobacter sp. UWEL]SHK35225.1 hypothetical protein SAMN05720468_101189 [Fibrobacter sp. UWEL]